jgi:predicted helicase
LPIAGSLSEEAEGAGKIKRNEKILVITGNPPYSVSSSNVIQKGSELYNVYESYKEIVRKEEKNIQPLSDDYIKFIAFAHYKIQQAGKGIVGIITNNSYLDGLIHRDLRRKLSEDFDEIYILNLHGNSKRKEKNPTGGKDENVFNIQQGVGIILLVKK